MAILRQQSVWLVIGLIIFLIFKFLPELINSFNDDVQDVYSSLKY